MSSSASTSASSDGRWKRRFEKENNTIISSVLPEDESDEDYVDEESDDEVIDGEHEIIYIDDDEVDIPSLPGESKIDSAQVDAWARRLPGNKAVPHGLARERIVRSQERTRGMNRR